MKHIPFFSSIIPFALAQEIKWSDPTGNEPAKIQDLAVVIKRILNISIRLAGLAVFIMLIVGGFQYLTAGGDPKKTQAASSTLTHAVIGLVILIAVWFVFLLIEKFTGVTITQFEIPWPEKLNELIPPPDKY